MITLSRAHLWVLMKYGLVGVTGTIIDIGLLYLLVEYGHVALIPAAMISFVFAVANNFFWNKRWTFGDSSPRYLKQYAKYLIVSVCALVLNVIVLYALTTLFGLWYIFAKLATSGVIFVWNFTMNKFWTFRSYAIPRPTIHEKPLCDLTIVIPAYNEEKNIEAAVNECRSYCDKKNLLAEIIVSDDGSSDTTRSIVLRIAESDPRVRLIEHEKNHGKGRSVHDGMSAATGGIILFMDADSATPISEFDTCRAAFKNGADIVIGSRYLRDSKIVVKQPRMRVLLGRIGNLLIQLVLLEGIVDTQCGFKAFTFSAARSIIPRQRIWGWGFDMELLSIGRQMGFIIKEVPVSWTECTSRKSRFLPLKDAHRTLKELMIIKINLMTKRYHEENKVIHTP
ncbi:MAG: glycosyltransferase [Patescibacteria group bacterium]